MGIENYQFKKGQPKIGGRKPGVRNRIGHRFLKDLQAEWERSGAAALKIMAKEQPSEFAKLTASLLPKEFSDEFPARITIVTGVMRAGDMVSAVTVPQIAAGVPEHVRMGFETKARLSPCAFDHAGEAGGREWRSTF
jgi:hypothetical protein